MVTIFLTEILGLWYVASNALGASAGGTVSFALCRLWVFNRRSQRWHHQAMRYVLAICLSLSLNTLGVWCLTESFHISYVVSKIIAAVLVGVSVNFLMFRYFVFK
jgi:putative flippase GtrA